MDFLIFTVMKVTFKKHSPTERHLSDYKYFDQTNFKNDLNEKLKSDSHLPKKFLVICFIETPVK